MNKDSHNWNIFWGQTKHVKPLSTKAELWSDLVWKVGLEYWHDLFLELASGKNLLECGCGSARLSQYMASRGFECTLLDNSEEAIQVAKSNFSTLSLPAKFHVGNINHLPFEDGQFDIVFSGGVLHHFETLEAPIQEMVRILKPGGLFAATMITKKFSCQTLANMEIRLAHFMRDLCHGKFEEALKSFTPQEPFYVNSIPLKTYKSICEKAGLQSVVGLGTSPFPGLSLPSRGQKLYGRLMKKCLPFWKKFDTSPAQWTEIWGSVFRLYGIKK